MLGICSGVRAITSQNGPQTPCGVPRERVARAQEDALKPAIGSRPLWRQQDQLMQSAVTCQGSCRS